MAAVKRCLCRLRGGHRWRYAGTSTFTGHIERCEHCHTLRQVPQ
jgi:hypothetical protein